MNIPCTVLELCLPLHALLFHANTLHVPSAWVCLQTYNNVLHVYGMHSSKEAVLSTSSALGGPTEHIELKRVDIYLQQSQTLSNGGANASDLVGDSRSLLLGFSDGTMQLFSWQAKVCLSLASHNVPSLLHPASKKQTMKSLQKRKLRAVGSEPTEIGSQSCGRPQGVISYVVPTISRHGYLLQLRATLTPFSAKETLRVELQRSTLGARRPSLGERERAAERRPPATVFHKGPQLGTGRSAQLNRTSSTLSRTSSTDRLSLNRQGSADEEKHAPGIECMDYSSRLHLVAAVLTDGRCAILRAGASAFARLGCRAYLPHTLLRTSTLCHTCT